MDDHTAINGSPILRPAKPPAPPLCICEARTFQDLNGSAVITWRAPLEGYEDALPAGFAPFVATTVLQIQDPAGNVMYTGQVVIPIPGEDLAEAFGNYAAALDAGLKAEQARIMEQLTGPKIIRNGRTKIIGDGRAPRRLDGAGGAS